MASRKSVITITVIRQRFREAETVLVGHDVEHVRVDIVVDDLACLGRSFDRGLQSIVGRDDDLAPVGGAEFVAFAEKVGVFRCELHGEEVGNDYGRGAKSY